MPKRSPFRYARIDRLAALSGMRAKAFQDRSCAIIGLGNIGHQVAYHLALMGFPLILVDNGRVEEVNLGTQGFSEDHLGEHKVIARAVQLNSLNPDCKITAIPKDITTIGAGHFWGAQAMFSCLDSWQSRSALHEIAWELGILFIDCGLDGTGERFYGRLSIYDSTQPGSACMFCSWDAETFRAVREQELGEKRSCSGLAVGVSKRPTDPTLMVSSMGGILSGMAVIQALRLLFGDRSATSPAREFLIDMTSSSFSALQLKRNVSCVFPHQRWPLRMLKKTTAELTVSDLFDLASQELDSPVRVFLHRKHLIKRMMCQNGHIRANVYRISETFRRQDCVCQCGQTLVPVGQELSTDFSLNEASEFLHKTWQQLGLPKRDIVTVQNAERAVRYVFS